MIAMHLPDGILAPAVWGALALAAAGCVALAVRRTRALDADGLRTPLVGLAAAFVFVSQMVNFPVASAVSGHLVGAALLVVLVGPWLASLTMAAILIVQALVLQDGGITALGANFFNLGVVAVWVAHACVVLAGRRKLAGAFVGAWLGTVAAAVAAALELAASGVAGAGKLLALMGGIHAVIGLGEAVVTVMILKFVGAQAPDLNKGEAYGA
ncbi:energy-coupling factor ABC transporter permease [soil metagenome]